MRGDGTRAGEIKKCFVCGKDFYVKRIGIERSKTNTFCCSKKCDGIKKSTMYMGQNNPNHIHSADYSCIYNLDKFGAYILGLIWSDGHLPSETWGIYIYQNGSAILNQISEKIFGKCLTKERKSSTKMFELVFNDKELVEYILSLGGINRGKKSKTISIPNIPDEMIWPFICGYFDGDGGFKYNYKYPEISISSDSPQMLESVSKIWGVNYTGKDKIYASGNKALDICDKMYGGMPIKLNRKYSYYLDMLNWEPLPCGAWDKDVFFKFKKLDKNAIAPQKGRVTDSGYDVFAINFEAMNEEAGIYIADMRLAVEPIMGWYFDLIGRSSLPLNNLHFLGGVGVIDKTYTGSLKMIVQKIDLNKPLPETPFKIAQLIPRRVVHFNFREVDELSGSDRGSMGFGSTGK